MSATQVFAPLNNPSAEQLRDRLAKYQAAFPEQMLDARFISRFICRSRLDTADVWGRGGGTGGLELTAGTT